MGRWGPPTGESSADRPTRTETTINDPGDFHVGKRLVNLPALREIGFSASRRLLGAQRLDCDPIAGKAVLDHVTKSLTASSGTRVSGLALGDPRSDALLHALEVFRLMFPGGFRNADLRTLVAQLRGLPEDALTPGQMTYDLRRLREHGSSPRKVWKSSARRRGVRRLVVSAPRRRRGEERA